MNKVALSSRRPDFPTILSQFLITVAVCLLGTILFSLLGTMIATMLPGGEELMSKPSNLTDPKPEMLRPMQVIQVFSVTGLFLVPAMVLPRLLYKADPWEFNGLRRSSPALLYLLPVLLFFTLMPVLEIVYYWNQQMDLPASMDKIEKFFRSYEETAARTTAFYLNMRGPLDLLVNIFVIAVMAAIPEELFFRGFLQRMLGDWTRNPHVAVILSAFLFSAIHVQFFGFVPRFMLGVILGYLYFWSGNLKIPILFHFLNNFMTVVQSYVLSQRGEEVDPTATHSFHTGMYILSAILSAGVMYYFWKRSRRIPLPTTISAAAHAAAISGPGEPWESVYITDKLYQAEIVAGNLRNEGISAMVINKQGSSHVNIGHLEVRVPRSSAEKARELINSFEI